MEYRSVSDLCSLVINNLQRIPKDIDIIVGIPRSGLFVANYIALLMNKPLTDLNGFEEDRLISSGNTKNTDHHITKVKEAKKVLVVDDSVCSGNAMNLCRRRIESLNREAQYIFLAVFVLPTMKSSVDIYFEEVDSPRYFEWNLFHHVKLLRNSCFDLDGVLCEDPSPTDNDDGEKYEHFIKNTPVKILPSCELGYIVTSRLEKYREQTETWLKSNNIKYKQLIMLDATAEERVKYDLHAKHKAEYYKKTNTILFFESNEKQALEINRITQKPVYCVETNTLYQGNGAYALRYEVKGKLKKKISAKIIKSKVLKTIYHRLRKIKNDFVK